MAASELDLFYQSLQKACLPGVWSKGISLARSGAVRIDLFSDKEIILRVTVPDRTVSQKVSLWPGDEDHFCDCGDRADPCVHVAAAVAALKTGLRVPENSESGVPTGPVIQYRLLREDKILRFERWVGEREIRDSLVALIGGIDSGRISAPRIDATQDDFAVDYALGEKTGPLLDRRTWMKLLPVLRALPSVTLDGVSVEVGASIHGVSAELRDDFRDGRAGFRLVGVENPELRNSDSELFSEGLVLVSGVLRLLEDPGFTEREKKILLPPGYRFSGNEIPSLIEDIIPSLERKIPLKILAERLPVLSESPPRIELRLERIGKGVDEKLEVVPALVYDSDFPKKDPTAEKQLLRKLQADLQLTPGHRVEYGPSAAIDFIRRAADWELKGEALQFFIPEAALQVELQADESDFQVSFRSPSGKSADPHAVLKAWSANENLVRLNDGGYSALPQDWLARFGPGLARLFLLRESGTEKLPSAFRPELIDLVQESGGQLSAGLEALGKRLSDTEGLPHANLPLDLQATLRPYQQTGVDWLTLLRDSDMGALLADDMGLGKTIQALCAIRGKTLIVCPTSVLQAWSAQIRGFRPGLQMKLYYGSSRKWDPSPDVTLTTYGLLRQDRDLILAESWDGIILDEAQTIKNPDSQVAKAAHLLRAKFRLTLSGTPVENSLEDLWSQFRFLNPGLLGTRAEFQENFSGPISRGEVQAIQRLRKLVRPFILRRMKKEVAPELPPRTEGVLEAEFSPSEQVLYDSLLAASRKEVLAQMAEGGSVFGALEQLLRLRQACCHPSLIPGQKAETSAKLDLLETTLENSVAMGHRVLIFSQWTSFLDLIEVRVQKMGLGFLRLDGATRDRESVVNRFQDPSGPPVMLISLKAGGVGITLTAADHVFLMDSWWNPAVEDQAADRAHRIGQENPVFIYRFVVRNTLEERILELQKQKLELSNSVLEGGGAAISLTRDDIRALLS